MTAVPMFLGLIAAHAVCDYPLQGDFLAKAKNRLLPIPGVPWWQALGAHAAIHGGAVTRPVVQPDLMALARHIERQRNGQNLQLIDVEDIEYEGQIHVGVKVMLLDLANEPEACLGFAWLGGSGRDVLEPALRAARAAADAARDDREAA